MAGLFDDLPDDTGTLPAQADYFSDIPSQAEVPEESFFDRAGREVKALYENPAEAMAGSIPVRFAAGAAEPIIGAAQLASRYTNFPMNYLTDKAMEAMGKPSVSDQLAAVVNDWNRTKAEGQALWSNKAPLLQSLGQGSMGLIGLAERFGGGADAAGFVGNVLSPVPLKVGAAITPAKTLLPSVAGRSLGRAGQMAGLGAGLGAIAPSTKTGEEYLPDMTERAAYGALGGALIPALGSALRGGGGYISKLADLLLREGGKTRAAGRVVADVAGDRAPEVISALRAGAAPETAAGATANLGMAEMSGLERMLSRIAPSDYGRIGTVAKGREAAVAQMWDELNAATGPIREKVLQKANKPFAGGGQSGIPISSVVDDINSQLSTPGLSGSDTAQSVLGAFKNKLTEMASKTGRVDANDLYTVRKELGEKILKLARQEGWDKALTKGLVREVQKSIDSTIGRASGTMRPDGTSAWTDYIGKFREGAKEISGITQRAKESAIMGREGEAAARKVFSSEAQPVTIPNILYRPAMVANTILQYLEGKGGSKTANELARLFLPQNKSELATILEQELAKRSSRGLMTSGVRQRIGTGMLQAGERTGREDR